MTEKISILENQITSLKEIVQIQENQLSTTTNSPEEILTGWRTKVYELLVKNNLLLKQNRDFEASQLRLQREREAQNKKSTNELAQKEAEVRQLRNKLETLKIEQENLHERNEHLSTQIVSINQEKLSLRTYFNNIVKTIEEKFTKEAAKMRDIVTSKISEINNKTNGIHNNANLLKKLYSQRIVHVSGENQGFKTSLAQILEDLLNSENNQVTIKIPREKDEIVRLTRAICENNKTLTRKLNDAQGQLNKLQNELKENTSESQVNSKKFSELNTILTQKDVQIKELSENNRSLEKQLLELNSQRLSLQSQISNLNLEKSYREQEVEALKRSVQEFELERGEIHTNSNRILAQSKQTDEKRSKEIESLNNHIRELEAANKEQMQKLTLNYEEKVLTLEKQKDMAAQSLKAEIENLRRDRAIVNENHAKLETALEEHKEKTASFSNQINDLLKIIEMKDKNLERAKMQQSGTGPSSRGIIGRDSVAKNGLYSSLQTPQTKLQRDGDRSRSPYLGHTEQLGGLSRIESRGFRTEKSINNQSLLMSRIEAVEKKAYDILDDI